MSTADIISECANCGKGQEAASIGDLKACMACKLVKYCNRECQIAHRAQHKKACKKRAAFLAAELHDEALFKEPPPLSKYLVHSKIGRASYLVHSKIF